MGRDLTDREAARRLGKHLRTIQRWCQTGVLPNAHKLGRSWRIPEADLWGAQVGQSADEAERALRAARLACEDLRAEVEAARATRSAPAKRNWRRIAREVAALAAALRGLPDDPSKVPSWLDRG